VKPAVQRLATRVLALTLPAGCTDEIKLSLKAMKMATPLHNRALRGYFHTCACRIFDDGQLGSTFVTRE
jgi:hypothetical protein